MLLMLYNTTPRISLFFILPLKQQYGEVLKTENLFKSNYTSMANCNSWAPSNHFI